MLATDCPLHYVIWDHASPAGRCGRRWSLACRNAGLVMGGDLAPGRERLNRKQEERVCGCVAPCRAAGCGLMWLGGCSRWLPVRLPGFSLATLTLGQSGPSWVGPGAMLAQQ